MQIRLYIFVSAKTGGHQTSLWPTISYFYRPSVYSQSFLSLGHFIFPPIYLSSGPDWSGTGPKSGIHCGFCTFLPKMYNLLSVITWFSYHCPPCYSSWGIYGTERRTSGKNVTSRSTTSGLPDIGRRTYVLSLTLNPDDTIDPKISGRLLLLPKHLLSSRSPCVSSEELRNRFVLQRTRVFFQGVLSSLFLYRTPYRWR